MDSKNATDLGECFAYLDDLRESAVTNMFGAAPYLHRDMGLPIQEARDVLGMWQKTFSDAPAYQRAATALAS